MMRLCTIVFPESSSSRTKEYTFKIPKMLYVREGDILRNPNYGNAPVKVVRVFDYPVNNVYNGYILKELEPLDTQIESPSARFDNNQTNNNMEKRNITVSLEDAGKSSYGMLGPGNLIMASLGSSLDYNDDFKKLVARCLLGPLGGLLCGLKSKEEEK